MIGHPNKQTDSQTDITSLYIEIIDTASESGLILPHAKLIFTSFAKKCCIFLAPTPSCIMYSEFAHFQSFLIAHLGFKIKTKVGRC